MLIALCVVAACLTSLAVAVYATLRARAMVPPPSIVVSLDPAPIAAALATAVAAAMRDAFAAEGLREIGQPMAPILAVEPAVAALPRTSSMQLHSIVYDAVNAQLNFEAEHVPAQNVRLQTAAPPLNGTARPVGHYDFDQRVESICIRAQALSPTPLDPAELRAEVIREIQPLHLNTEIADDRRYARRTTLEAVK